MWRAVFLAAITALSISNASADDYDRTIWRRVEVAPGISQDYEVRFEYRLPMVGP